MYKELKDVGLYGQVTAQSKNCADIKDIQDKNTVAPKDFFDDFQRWNDGL